MSARPRSTLTSLLLAVVLAAGSNAQASPPSCVWKVYDAARGEPQVVFTDPDATPPWAMRFQGDFHTAGRPLAQSGGLDFDGDGRSDAFRLAPRGGGLTQLQYVAPGSSSVGWQNLGYDIGSLDTYHFGDFDADGRTDVFRTFTSGTQWVYSSGGTASYANLHATASNFTLGFGRVDADAKTDVFALVPTPTTDEYDFEYSAGGTVSLAKLSTHVVARLFSGPLRFVDFDGNGKTDVLQVVDNGNDTADWNFIADGGATLLKIATRPFQARDLQFGDFDGDGKTDAFSTRTLPDGRLEWIYWPGGIGNPIVLDTVDGPVPRLGEFAGDGRTDALVVECGAEPLLASLPETTLPKTPASRFQLRIGDVNGDGHPDAIRASTCQSFDPYFFYCGTSAKQVQVLFGDGHGGFSEPTPLQTVPGGTDTGLGEADLQSGDLDGDGLADLFWIKTTADVNSLEVHEAIAAADGSFSDRPKQTLSIAFALHQWETTDLNHDGRPDLVFTSVCQKRRGFDRDSGCSLGDDNQVATALTQPDGTFKTSLTPLGASGWASYDAFEGDVNGDGNADVVFNSTCQSPTGTGACTNGTANLVRVALGDGQGAFTLGPLQTLALSGWERFSFTGVLDLNGDGRDDLVWIDNCADKASGCDVGTSLVIQAGLANADGTFTVTSAADMGFGYWLRYRYRSGDVDGDGKSDLILMALGTDDEVAAVYVLFSDGAGGFTPSPMQILHGREWNHVGIEPSIADLTGDGKAELTWFDGLPFDHDRIVVTGIAAALAPTTTTTTTTLPPSSDCTALSGLAGAQCYCAAPLAPAACAGATLPAKFTTKFAKACTLLGTASGASEKKQKKLLGKTAGRFGALAHAASKKATKKLPAGCGDGLRSVFTTIREDVRAARQAAGH